MKNQLIKGMGILVVTAGVLTFIPREEVSLVNPEVITWEKPTNDKEWAEDIKIESLDIRSPKELQEMLAQHIEKLNEIVKPTKLDECPECVRYEMKEDFITAYQLEGRELEDLLDKEMEDKINNRKFEIEKLKQSIERINKAIELQ